MFDIGSSLIVPLVVGFLVAVAAAYYLYSKSSALEKRLKQQNETFAQLAATVPLHAPGACEAARSFAEELEQVGPADGVPAAEESEYESSDEDEGDDMGLQVEEVETVDAQSDVDFTKLRVGELKDMVLSRTNIDAATVKAMKKNELVAIVSSPQQN